MIKILLCLMVIFSSGVVGGEWVVLPDEGLVEQQLDFCEQDDNKKIDFDDQEGPVSLVGDGLLVLYQENVRSILVFHSLVTSVSDNFIRAPPISF